MAGSWFAKRRADFAWVARGPSHRAPHPAELLNPEPFTPPTGPRMSAEERQLLDAVLAEPDADGPRLRYAEWCDRQGDPRGAFIREQLRTPDAAPPAAVSHGALQCFSPWSARDLVFRRGFVEGMSLAGRAFISLGAPLFRLTPLREVRLVAIAPFLDELERAPHVGQLRTLDLRGNGIEEAEIQPLQKQWPQLVLLR